MKAVKKFKLTKLIFFLILLASCSDINRQSKLPSYINPENINMLTGDTVLENAMAQMDNPSQNWIIGDTIVFNDINDKYIYSIVSISGDSIIGRMVSRGEGPGELLRPSNLQVDSDKKLSMFDDTRGILYQEFTLKDFFNGIDSIRTLHFKETTGSYLLKSNEGFISDNLYGDGNIFTFYDKDGHLKNMFGLVPGTKILEDTTADFYMSYQVIFAISPDKKNMCVAGVYHDWLAFFDVSTDSPRLIKEYFTSPPVVESNGKDERYHLETLPNTINHYFTIAPYNDGVFLNYFGVSQENLNNGNVSSHILQYSWDGEIKKIFSPQEKIYELSATQDGKQLYATFSSDDTSDIKLIRYSVNK